MNYTNEQIIDGLRRCERCGDLVYYDTAFYCDNGCKSRVNGNQYDVVFCSNCVSDENTICPICGEKKIGR